MSDSIIDVNVHLSRWPTRRYREDETPKLVSKLAARGIVEAWAGSFEGVLHKDISGVNARLVEECRSQATVRLIPFGSINLKLPGWEEDVRRCAEEFRMLGIRLHPNYHGYKLSDPLFDRLLELAGQLRLIVTLALSLEDERMMHPLLKVPPVDVAGLAEAVSRVPAIRLVLLNAMNSGALRGERLQKLLKAGEVYVEIAMLEGMGGVARLLNEVPADRVLFGSNAPAFYIDSAMLKLRESSLNDSQQRAIRFENARRLVPAAST